VFSVTNGGTWQWDLASHTRQSLVARAGKKKCPVRVDISASQNLCTWFYAWPNDVKRRLGMSDREGKGRVMYL
jgi:hypothetical protein